MNITLLLLSISIQVYIKKKDFNFKIKIGKKKNYDEKSIVHWYIVTSLLLTLLIQCLMTSLFLGFRNSHILDLFCSNPLTILVLFCKIIWIIEFTRPNS
jgi:hypothetical protein